MTDPHRGLPVLAAGVPLAEARAAMILVHGRGASAADVMTIAAEVMHPGIAYLAPEAAGDVWFPHPFTAPVDSNEPYLGSALGVIETLLTRVGASIPARRRPRARFRPPPCPALRRRRRSQWGSDRTGWHIARLSRQLRRHAGLRRVQRR